MRMPWSAWSPSWGSGGPRAGSPRRWNRWRATFAALAWMGLRHLPRRPVLLATGGRRRMTASELCLHGHRIAVSTAGNGPVLLLIHASPQLATWTTVLPWLAERYCVVAP